jgi:hypothetical protein
MENTTNLVGGVGSMADAGMPLPKDWRTARASHVYLHLMGTPRVNLLLIGIDGGVWNVLETLLPDLHQPIATWSAGQRLVLPPVTRTGTMILHDVGALTLDDQRRLLEWSERAAGLVQIISTTSSPLLPRVHAGAFFEILYYRLNTVSVDVTAIGDRTAGPM